MDLVNQNNPQYDIFSQQDTGKQLAAMAALDTVNSRWGAGTLFYAGAGIKKPWAMKRDLKSPHYTTEWKDILRIKQVISD
jgi:DNA polymerase V